jgi:hypothetical protein
MEMVAVIFFTAQSIILLVAIFKHRQNIRWRYTTRHLLVGMTLIAMAVAMVAGLAR